MNRRSLKVFSVSVRVVISAMLLFFVWWRWNQRAAAREFQGLFGTAGSSHIDAIFVSGQQPSVTVTDQETLSALEECFRYPTSGPLQLGLSYEVIIKFKSGAKFITFAYVHDDKGGLTVADPSVDNAGDPQMIVLRFQRPLSEKVRALVDYLSK